jgi:regulator of RNase E activity RraA
MAMNPQELFVELRKFDTPTIANALEIAQGRRSIGGFTRQTLIAASPKLPPIVGYAKTVRIRCSTPYDPAVRRRNQLAYYEYLAQAPQPTVAIVQDIDEQPGIGAFWGEVNTNVHWGLGCVGAVTDGSMRDLAMMHPQFQCLAATLAPSHAWVQVIDFGGPVEVLGMNVANGDVVHADLHGAIVIPHEALDKRPAAIDLMARREKVILAATRQPGFGIAALRDALAASDLVK